MPTALPAMLPAIVVGEGIAAQACTLALLEAEVPVRLLSAANADQSLSAARRDGIDAAIDSEDSPETHAADLAKIGENLANPLALEALAAAAPEIVQELERLGVPFERGRNGRLSAIKLAGSSIARSFHASSLTARYVSRRLGARLLAFDLERRIGYRFLRLALDDDGRAVGVVAKSLRDGEVVGFEAHGICLATGGYEGLFTAPDENAFRFGPARLGDAIGAVSRQGARLENLERIRFSPLGYDAGGIVRRFPERLLALGAKVSDALLDLAEIPRDKLRAAAGPTLDAYSETTGRDPQKQPISVFSVPDRSLGGLAVDLDHATNIVGLYAAGSAACQYHGAHSPSGSGLLAALFGGRRAAEGIRTHREQTEPGACDLDAPVTSIEIENRFELEAALRARMTRAFAGERENLDDELAELETSVSDDSELVGAIALARAWAGRT